MDDCEILSIRKSVIGDHGHSNDDASTDFIFDLEVTLCHDSLFRR